MTSAAEQLSLEREPLIACGKVLGALFYLTPGEVMFDDCLGLIDNLPQQWPYGDATALAAIQQQLQQQQHLRTAHQTLFIGPGHLAAPPWGSVYLDEESVVYGSSTLAWRAFLREQQLTLDTGNNDPEDHFGLICWALAQLAEQQNWPGAQTLLEQHLLPWSGHYLDLLQQHAPAGFYQGLAALAALTLDNLRQIAGLHPAERRIYFRG